MAEERFSVREDNGGGDGGGVVAAERGRDATGSAIESPVACALGFGEAVSKGTRWLRAPQERAPPSCVKYYFGQTSAT